MIKIPVCSFAKKTSPDAAARNIIQSLLVTTFILGVTECPLQAQLAPVKVSSKILQSQSINVRLNSAVLRNEWGVVKTGDGDAVQTDSSIRAQLAPVKMQPKILQPERIIKVGLNRSGVKDEWGVFKIVNDDAGQTVRAYHTSQVRNDFLSTVATLAVNVGAQSLASDVIFKGYTGPVWTPDINFHNWADHPTRNLTFIPDGCDPKILDPQSSCVIKGTDTLRLPMGMKIQAGQLTIEYLEETLVRSVTLRIPSE